MLMVLNKRLTLSAFAFVAVAAWPCLAPHARAQQPNAWQINDNSGLTGVLGYVTNLTPAQVSAANSNGWHYSLLSRILSDTTSPASHSMAFGDGTRRFYIYFDLDTSGNLTAQLLSSSNVIYTLPASAVDVLKYHLHEMVYDPGTGKATYRFDGNAIATWPGNLSAGQSNQVMWGANSSGGAGVMNYHRAEFDVTGFGAIATYDAGFAGTPVTAPSPTNQGWTRLTNGVPLLESPLSPDAEFIHPVAVTAAATSLRPGQATLNGNINPSGWPAVCWFDHGPTTSYGNSTPTTALGNGTAFVAESALITGLPRGAPYHFRVVASNNVGTVIGGDMSFTVLDSSVIPSGATGGGQPFDIRQPSLELNFILCTNGTFPSQDGSTTAPFLGEMRLFAGNFTPAGWVFCQGQLLNVSSNIALYNLLGTSFGGDGVNNFGIPDLRSETITATGMGPGTSSWFLGEETGLAQVTLGVAQIPPHTHSLPAPYAATGSTGGSQPRLNLQPSLALSGLICLAGYYPLATQTIYQPFLGQMPIFAAGFAPGGYVLASGQLLPINQNQLLYSVLGTNYGGDGQITFGLPYLSGRTPMGIGQGQGTSVWTLAQMTGSESVTMAADQMPAHQHAVPWLPPLGFLTGVSGSNQPQSLLKPVLALQFLIATNGEAPSLATQATNEMTGEIQIFAGLGIPLGWTPCNGQLLSIASNPGLFNVISNFFGGDGVSTFALPNLSGRIPVGCVTGQPGAAYGAEQAVLTEAQLPAHTHTVPALDYDRWVTALGLSNSLAAFGADPDGDGILNGFEWATGTNPTNAQSFVPLQIMAAGNAVNIQFPRNTNATDVIFTLQRSTDLSTPMAWTGLATNSQGAWSPPAIVSESAASNPAAVTVFDPTTNNSAAYYRLKVVQP